MTKEIHQALTFQRVNLLKTIIYEFFFAICSYPRLVIEVIMHREMGNRYFGAMSALTVATILALIPYFLLHYYMNFWDIFTNNLLWYFYVGVFLYFSFYRWLEVHEKPGFIDLSHYTVSVGYTQERYMEMWKSWLGYYPNQRTMNCYLEPLPFFLAGVVLAALGQYVGWLLTLCSICYCVSYLAGYFKGDNAIKNIADKEKFGRQLVHIFMHDRKPKDAEGVTLLFSRPDNTHDTEDIGNKLSDDSGEDISFAS